MLYVWGQAPLVLFWGLVVLVNVLVSLAVGPLCEQ